MYPDLYLAACESSTCVSKLLAPTFSHPNLSLLQPHVISSESTEKLSLARAGIGLLTCIFWGADALSNRNVAPVPTPLFP